jgi:ABC-type bacteriocin/lantibiotic exporter with double-glycine peptidase domain
VHERDEEEQFKPELLQLYFDSFKHMSTLATATAVITGVITERVIPEKAVAALVLLLILVLLAASLVISVEGMTAATRYMAHWEAGAAQDFDHRQSQATRTFMLALFVLAAMVVLMTTIY